MKIVAIIGALAISGVAFAASNSGPSSPATAVITVPHSEQTENLKPDDISVLHEKTPIAVSGLERLNGNLADMQLFVLLDDSTRSSALGVHIAELKKFLGTLPSTTQVGIGYMRNGTFGLAQAFTADHAKAAAALRLPIAMPGVNGSPYFVLSDLAKHWPSKEATRRRVVLMLTDGVDRYYTQRDMNDPYVEASIDDSLKAGLLVYSIYLRGAGFYGLGDWTTNMAQSRLMEVSDATGGYAYFQGFIDPVTIVPFLNDLSERLDNQYRVRLDAMVPKGVRSVTIRGALPALKIEGPKRIYVP